LLTIAALRVLVLQTCEIETHPYSASMDFFPNFSLV
jgi:hypothetical protein